MATTITITPDLNLIVDQGEWSEPMLQIRFGEERWWPLQVELSVNKKETLFSEYH